MIRSLKKKHTQGYKSNSKQDRRGNVQRGWLRSAGITVGACVNSRQQSPLFATSQFILQMTFHRLFCPSALISEFWCFHQSFVMRYAPNPSTFTLFETFCLLNLK